MYLIPCFRLTFQDM